MKHRPKWKPQGNTEYAKRAAYRVGTRARVDPDYITLHYNASLEFGTGWGTVVYSTMNPDLCLLDMDNGVRLFAPAAAIQSNRIPYRSRPTAVRTLWTASAGLLNHIADGYKPVDASRIVGVTHQRVYALLKQCEANVHWFEFTQLAKQRHPAACESCGGAVARASKTCWRCVPLKDSYIPIERTPRVHGTKNRQEFLK